MKTENRMFAIVMVTMFIFAGLYAYWTWTNDNRAYGYTGQIEWVGFMALTFSGLLTGMIWFTLWLVSRRIDPRPEDRPDGEIADSAGEVGFFSPGSYWPIGLAGCAVLAAAGVAFWSTWLMWGSGIALVMAACGLTFEYYTGTRRVGGPE